MNLLELRERILKKREEGAKKFAEALENNKRDLEVYEKCGGYMLPVDYTSFIRSDSVELLLIEDLILALCEKEPSK